MSHDFENFYTSFLYNKQILSILIRYGTYTWADIMILQFIWISVSSHIDLNLCEKEKFSSKICRRVPQKTHKYLLKAIESERNPHKNLLET